VLWLPGYAAAPRAAVVARAEPPADGIYRVRRGDNLAIIASRFDVSQADLLSWNRLDNRNQLSVGQRLRVSPPVTVLASAQLDAAQPAAGPLTDAGPATDAGDAEAADAPDDSRAQDIAEEAHETEAAAVAEDSASPDDASGGLLPQESDAVEVATAEVAEVEVAPPPPAPAEDAADDAPAPPAAAPSAPGAGGPPPAAGGHYAGPAGGRLTAIRLPDESLFQV
jgi:LysM repeat protein